MIVLIRMCQHVGYISERHMMLAGALLSPLAGAAALSFAVPLRRLVSENVLLLTLPIAGAAAMTIYAGMTPLHAGRLYLRQGGEELHRLASDGRTAVVGDVTVMHYADLPTRYLPLESIGAKELSADIVTTGVSYVVITDRQMAANPPLRTLLSGSMFREVFMAKGGRGRDHDAVRIWLAGRDSASSKE